MIQVFEFSLRDGRPVRVTVLPDHGGVRFVAQSTERPGAPVLGSADLVILETSNETGEMSIEIAAPMRPMGLDYRLTQLVLLVARQHGLTRVTARSAPGDAATADCYRRLGARQSRAETGELLHELSVVRPRKEPSGTWSLRVVPTQPR
jgi:hypothetical protein